MLESSFQANLKKDLSGLFPGCIVLKNDPSFFQGVPDLIILYNNKWATLECKRSMHEKHQPNQDYYVQLMNKLSFSDFICPENREKVLMRLYAFFKK